MRYDASTDQFCGIHTQESVRVLPDRDDLSVR